MEKIKITIGYKTEIVCWDYHDSGYVFSDCDGCIFQC